MSEQVAIIGSGPAGLLAAHAAVLRGFNPVILSPGAKKSPVPPAVFVHEPIPAISNANPDDLIYIKRRGDPYVYAAKVYRNPQTRTSWEKLDEAVRAWAFAPIYDRLWEMYRDLVDDVEVQPSGVDTLLDSFPTVINTAPMSKLCAKQPGAMGPGHKFPYVSNFIIDEAPEEVEEQTMVYNGDRGYAWSRSSRIFGVASTEYPQPPARTDGLQYRQGIKVLPNECDCHPRMIRAGRWGTWMPGVLLHHAYHTAARALDAQRAWEGAYHA